MSEVHCIHVCLNVPEPQPDPLREAVKRVWGMVPRKMVGRHSGCPSSFLFLAPRVVVRVGRGEGEGKGETYSTTNSQVDSPSTMCGPPSM